MPQMTKEWAAALNQAMMIKQFWAAQGYEINARVDQIPLQLWSGSPKKGSVAIVRTDLINGLPAGFSVKKGARLTGLFG